MTIETGDQQPKRILVKKCSSCGESHEVEVKTIAPITFGQMTYTRGFDCPNNQDLVVVWQEFDGG